MLRKLSIGLLSALIAQQVATAQQNPNDPLSAAAEAAAAAFDNPTAAPPGEPVPAPVAEAQTDVAVEAQDAQVAGDGEILVTGPLHEGYAEQFTVEATPGLIVSKQPPEPVEEVPPEYRPDGYNVTWIPGYWGWDLERDDFVWVTGIWRQAPPDRSWIPGYWAETSDGYQWISGFWAANDVEEVVYLPAPPEPIEAAPSSEPPGDNYFWIPGQWTYIENDYQWRAGYWSVAHPDWVWVPERYVYTPAGYIYRAGYWDYVLTDRGTIFCPVYWSHPVATYRLQPTYVVNVGTGLLANLFVYPHYHHYYYGNYYTSRHLGQTIYPWVTITQQTRLYDPLYSYYQTQHRDVAFLQRVSRMHTYYASNPNLQPARTLQMQMRNTRTAEAGEIMFRATQLQNLVDNRDTPLQFVRVRAEEREQLRNALEPARQLRVQRAQSEVQSSATVAQNEPADAANPQAGEEGRQGDNKRGGRGNRWRLPTNKEGMTLGAAAVVGGQREGQRDNRRGDRARRDEAQGADAQARAGADVGNPADQPSDANVPSAEPRNADRPGANATDKPSADKPAADMPATDKPGADKPAADMPDADKPGADRPNADKPGAGKPGVAQPRPDQPSADKPETDRPGRPQLGEDRPGRDLPPQQAAGTDRPSGERPGDNRPGGNRRNDGLPGDRPRGIDRPGSDLPDANPRSSNRPNLDGVDANRPGADRPERPGLNRRGPDRPGNNLPGNNLPGNNLPGNNLPGASQPGGDRPGFDRRGANPPAADLSRPDAPSVDRPNAGRPGAGNTRPGGPGAPGSAQGSAPSTTPLGDRGPDRRPGAAAPNRPSPDRNPPGGLRTPGGPGAGQGSVQDDMRALRDMQRRDVERRRSAPPDARSLPQRPQPAPGSNRPDNDRGRGRNPGIVPGGANPGGGPAGGGAPRGGRGNDKDKDKDKK